MKIDEHHPDPDSAIEHFQHEVGQAKMADMAAWVAEQPHYTRSTRFYIPAVWAQHRTRQVTEGPLYEAICYLLERSAILDDTESLELNIDPDHPGIEVSVPAGGLKFVCSERYGRAVWNTLKAWAREGLTVDLLAVEPDPTHQLSVVAVYFQNVALTRIAIPEWFQHRETPTGTSVSFTMNTDGQPMLLEDVPDNEDLQEFLSKCMAIERSRDASS